MNCTVCHKDIARYDYIGNRPKYCFNCKSDDMRLILNVMCCVCFAHQAFFGIPGQKPTHCAGCKDKNMINVKTKNCDICKQHQPLYGYQNGKATHCGKCKLDGMINLKTKMCATCGKKASGFNYPGKASKYCFDCKLPGMVNRSMTICSICKTTTASYGVDKPTHCSNCKLPGMKNLRKKVCVVCKVIYPLFNYPDQEYGSHCNKCKLEGMINIQSKRCLSCNKQPCFNFPDQQKGLYCFDHKQPNMVDVISRRCLTPLCDIHAQKSAYRGYCARCFIHNFPDEKTSLNYKTKEKHVADFLKEKFPDYQLVFDKIIDGGCSRRRPDIYIDMMSHVIIIEIDENSHRRYDSYCEEARLHEIWGDFGFRPIVWIRFNPDSYKCKGTYVNGCFKICKKTGIQIVATEQLWLNRLDKLKKEIDHWIDNVPDISNTWKYLYYDRN